MEHLSPLVLSRLVDEFATPQERDHLLRCSRCTSELEELRHQTAALGELPDVRPPHGDWDELEARLKAEGLVEAVRMPARPKRSHWTRNAASIALFVAGAASGAAVMAGTTLRGEAESSPAAAARLEPTTDPGAALALVQDAEQTYMEALVHYRQLVGAQGVDEFAGDPHVRYAALQQLVRAGQAALSQAPADPFLNGLLASAMAEQEAVSRRISNGIGQDGWF